MANTKVTSGVIKDDAVGADQLASNSVVTASINDNAITTAKISDDAILTAKISNSAITNAKMSANSVDSDQYVDGSIDTAHIGDGQITSAKLDTNIAVSGTLNVTGVTTLATHLVLGDDDIIKIGAGDDMHLFHSSNVNQLQVDQELRIQKKTGPANMIVATPDGAVEVYYAGSKKLETTSSGVTVTGTAEIPNLTISGQQGTDGQVLTSTGSGVAWEDAGVAGIVTSADATAITIDSSERVGIGTGSPSEALTVAGHVDIINTAININLMETGVTDSNHRIRQNAGNLVIQKLSDDKGTATDRIHLDGGTGKVGIGTTSATSILELKEASIVPRLTLLKSGVISWYVGNPSQGTSNNFSIGTDSGGNTEILTMTNGGNVGIGTTSPNAPLSLGTSTSAKELLVYDGGTGNDLYAGFAIDSPQSNAFSMYAHDNGHIVFGTMGTDASTITERMRIHNSGCIGLGTTADRSLGTNITTTVTSGSAGSGFWLSTGNSSATSSKIISTVNGSVGELFIKQGSGVNGGSIIFQINDAEKFRINSNGNCTVAGALSKGSGSFRIDHPLESKKETHHLVHSFVEAPQADNIYRGVVQLENGTATINLDTVAGMTEGTFVALNTNTSCFTSNETDWDSVKGSISGNILTINCQNTSSTANVSWLVIGERHDQHMLDNDWTDDNGKVIVEPSKESK